LARKIDALISFNGAVN